MTRKYLQLLTLAAVVAGAWPGTAQPSDSAESAPTPRASAEAWNVGLPAVSDGLHTWLWTHHLDPLDNKQRQLTLFHADATHRPPKGPAWEKVTTLQGWLAPHGAAADDDTLWLIFDAGAVQKVTLRRGPIEDQWYFDQTPAKALPADTTVRATVAGHGKLWVLARVENQTALASLDRDLATPPPSNESAAAADNTAGDGDVLNLVLGLPRELPLQDSSVPEAEAVPTADETADANQPPTADAAESTDTAAVDDQAMDTPTAVPTDRLLVLERGRWRVVPLPEGWASNRPTQMVAPRDAEGLPDLLVESPSAGPQSRVTVYRADESATSSQPDEESPMRPLPKSEWASADLELPTTSDFAALRVQKQLVLVQHTPTAEGFAADLWVVRGETLTSVGQIVLDPSSDTPATGRWAAVNFGESVGLLAGDREVDKEILRRTADEDENLPTPGPTLTAMDLQGQSTLPAMPMTVEPEHPIAEAADYIILLSVVTMSTLLLFTFWRRDPTANQLNLPADLALADLMRRAFAGVIDLAPGLLVATTAFDLPLDEVYARWPGRGQGATGDLMFPGLTAIGVIVAHTAALEMLTGRSLGKFATGLRVTTLAGERPKPWQLLTRCLLKAFDLVAYLLLILPIISPYRQRLGDMVARTVVVMNAAAPASEQTQADEDRDGDAT